MATLKAQMPSNSKTNTFAAPGMHVLSMGAGVQTTACLLMFGKQYDHAIFADTREEHKETYDYIEQYLKPYCTKIGLTWHTVTSYKYDSLMDYCLDKKWVPTIPRLRTGRLCTDNFKLRPINRKLRELGATRKAPFNVHIGISIDESVRLGPAAYVDKPQYAHKVYPLIDAHISRAKCYEVIKEHGWPLPVKSGCDFCPFSGRAHVRSIYGKDPERYKKIVEMEKNDKRGMTMFGTPLTLSHSLDSFDNDMEAEGSTCDSGHCFT